MPRTRRDPEPTASACAGRLVSVSTLLISGPMTDSFGDREIHPDPTQSPHKLGAYEANPDRVP